MRRAYTTMIPRNDLRIPRETSPLSPVRNPESLGRMWIGVGQNASRTLAFGNKLSQIATLASSPASVGGSPMQYFNPSQALEYNMKMPYAGSVWVRVSSTNAAVTTGTIDPVSGLQVNSQVGWYCSRPSGVPVVTVGGSPAYNIPQWPLPDPTMINDATKNFWLIFIPDTSGGGTDNLYHISAVNQNTVTAGTNTIYKPLELQGGLTGETIDGELITYSSYDATFNNRLATDPSNNQIIQYITPRYTVGQIITARMVNGAAFTFPPVTGFPTSGTFLLEYSPSRQWGGVDPS